MSNASFAREWPRFTDARISRMSPEIPYSMLFRWFVGLNLDEEVWDATSFTPRPVAGGRRGQAVPGASGGAGAGPRSDFQRALHGRRHVAGSLGESQELSAETGKVGAAGGRSRQSHGELSRRAAVE